MAVTVFEGNLESVQKKVDELKKVYPDLKVEYWSTKNANNKHTFCRLHMNGKNVADASFDGDFYDNEEKILDFINSKVK